MISHELYSGVPGRPMLPLWRGSQWTAIGRLGHMERLTGFEPATSSPAESCSAIELQALINNDKH